MFLDLLANMERGEERASRRWNANPTAIGCDLTLLRVLCLHPDTFGTGSGLVRHMIDKETLIELAEAIRRAVLPHLDRAWARSATGVAESGDATFGIDEIAEDAAAGYIEDRVGAVAYYTEDRGLTVPSTGAEDLLVIDPIDGSRPARAGLESCVVSVASAPYTPDARLADVESGVVRGLREDTLFSAQRGRGAEFRKGGRVTPIELRETRAVAQMAWTAEFVGRPARATAEVLWPLIDASALAGGFFVLNSTAYSLTRLVSGQLDAVVDVGGRLLEEFPELSDGFRAAGRGQVVALFPYDIAAALLIAEESGCMVTDACGRSLGPKSLLESSSGNLLSVVAASTPDLHGTLLSEIDAGFERLRSTRSGAA